MKPSNEKVAPTQHDYSRETGYVEKPYEHQEYPKVVDGVTVTAEQAAQLKIKNAPKKPSAAVTDPQDKPAA